MEDLRISQEYFGVDLSAWEPALSRLPVPDLTVVLDVPVEVALRRLRAAGRQGPGADPRYLEHAVARYRRLGGGPGWLRLDAQAPAERNVAAIRAALLPLTANHTPGGPR